MESTLNGNGQALSNDAREHIVDADSNADAGEAAYRELAHLRRHMRLFANFSERVSRGAGLSTLEYQALLAIRTLSPRGATRNALCRELDLKWTVTEALTKRLEQSRLVQIEADAADRRFRRLLLTARGEALLARLATRHLEAIRRDIPGLIGTLKSLSDLESMHDEHRHFAL